MNNRQLYHKMLQQLCQWLPDERITRQRNGAMLVIGLYLGKAVHLSHIVRRLPWPGQDLSLVNRLWRFLDNPRMDVWQWYEPIARQLVVPLTGQPIRLVIDCTKVGFGHRVMMVGVQYRRRTLPLVWSIHRGSKGHTTEQQQIRLLQQLQAILPANSPISLVADAGFAHSGVLQWLADQQWVFVVRVPGHYKVRCASGDWYKINQLPLLSGQTRAIGWVRLTEANDVGWFWLLLHWEQGEDEPWYLLSQAITETRHMLRTYARRMWIEEMFGDMKGHGFDLETTHLRAANRINRLVWGVCVAYVWLISVGSWLVKRGLRRLIDCKSRRDKSYFRLGWDWIARCQRLGTPFPLRFVPYF
jgi:hypothetical protein